MRRVERGFTLLEILVVLSLLAVLLALVGGAIVGANRAVVKAERFTTALDETRAAQNFLRRAVSGALPLDYARGGAKQRVVFGGSAQQLEFVAPLPSSLGGGVYLHTLALHQGRLQVDFAELRGRDLQPLGQSQVLLRGVESLNISYRGYSPKGELTGWLPNWPWPTRLPRSVRIDAEVKGAIPWVAQTINLQLELSGAVGQ